MKSPVEWNNVPDAFEIVAEALYEADEVGNTVTSGTERTSYGEDGYIKFEMDGRVYSLTLYEEV